MVAVLLTLGLAVVLPSGFPLRVGVVVSSSMYPKIKILDLAVLEPVRYSGPPRPGQVAVYERGGALIIHEVAGFNGSYYTFRGVNNPVDDPPVPAPDVEYVVVAVVPATVWLSLLSVAGAASVVLSSRRRGNSPRALAATLFFMFFILAMTAAPLTAEQLAKPVVVPYVKSITRSGSTVMVEFGGLGANVSGVRCTAITNVSEPSYVAVSCSYYDNGTVAIYGSYPSYIIYVSLEYYNMTMVYSVG